MGIKEAPLLLKGRLGWGQMGSESCGSEGGGGGEWRLTGCLKEEGNSLASRMPLSLLKDQGSDPRPIGADWREREWL